MDIKSGRLNSEQYNENFKDMHAPLRGAAVWVEADRCYYCYDAPCRTACPTGIDIPGFIRNIASKNYKGAAELILKENILGGTCSRVCPTETLCEEACVRHKHLDKPVAIGLLQRFAVDQVIKAREPLFSRGLDTGKRVALVGAGPASMACAHVLARAGHTATLFEAKSKSGGLNEYGLAAYKMTDDFCAKEVEYILSIGGIHIQHNVRLGRDISLKALLEDFDAVFLGMGMGGVNSLGLENENCSGVMDAVDYIAKLRQSHDFSKMQVGKHVVVIGGGMTAIDIATQCKLLGADEVTIVYRRGQSAMKASSEEQSFAKIKGVVIRHNSRPIKLMVNQEHVEAIEFEMTKTDKDGATFGTNEFYTLPADMVFKAIGQTFESNSFVNKDSSLEFSPELSMGRIKVDDYGRTSVSGLWAGGDCVAEGEDLTVAAVQDGKIAAYSICDYLDTYNNSTQKQGE